MAIKLGEHEAIIDVEAELREFDWIRPKWTYDKLIAASPFRYDRTPSFFVNLVERNGFPEGTWSDSGAYDESYKSGGIVKLLAFLRNETYEETTEYLIAKYVELSESTDYMLILPRLRNNYVSLPLSSSIIETGLSPYLTRRKISEEVQSQAGVGKSRYYGFVAIPWYSPDGQLSNVKYRATRGKTFFYEKDARPIGKLVYGANLYNTSYDDLIVCEAEVDALSWRTVGVNAIAVGGVSFSKEQADIIRRMPFKRLIVAGDNDKAGHRFNAQVVRALRNERSLAVIDWTGVSSKDANEVLCLHGGRALRAVYEGAHDLPTLTCTL